MGGVFGIYGHICHRGHYGREHHVPLFGGILIKTHFYRLKAVYLCGQRLKGFLEFRSHTQALFGSAFEAEHYNVFYHSLCVVV